MAIVVPNSHMNENIQKALFALGYRWKHGYHDILCPEKEGVTFQIVTNEEGFINWKPYGTECQKPIKDYVCLTDLNEMLINNKSPRRYNRVIATQELEERRSSRRFIYFVLFTLLLVMAGVVFYRYCMILPEGKLWYLFLGISSCFIFCLFLIVFIGKAIEIIQFGSSRKDFLEANYDILN